MKKEGIIDKDSTQTQNKTTVLLQRYMLGLDYHLSQ